MRFRRPRRDTEPVSDLLVRKRLRQQIRRRADLENDLRFLQLAHQLFVAGGEDAVADPVGPQYLEDLAELLTAHLAAFLADVDRHAEARSAGLLDHRLHLAVVIPRATLPR